MATQRARFGTTLVNRAKTESLELQREHESTEQGRLDSARQAREAERKAKQAQEVCVIFLATAGGAANLFFTQEQRMAEIRERNERLAEERKALQMDSQTWYTSAVAMSDDEEEKRRKKGTKGNRKKAKDDDGFVIEDEVAAPEVAESEDEDEGIQPTDKVPTARARSKRKVRPHLKSLPHVSLSAEPPFITEASR